MSSDCSPFWRWLAFASWPFLFFGGGAVALSGGWWGLVGLAMMGLAIAFLGIRISGPASSRT